MSPLVQASGCVVWRPADADGDARELLVVHRPRYDDWSWPKGKVDPGESAEACALRELHEETGLEGILGPELTPTEYVDHKGREKVVRYWSVELGPITGVDPRLEPNDFEPDHFEPNHFEPNDEVDEVRWLDPAGAAALLSYPHDVELIDEVLALPRSAPQS